MSFYSDKHTDDEDVLLYEILLLVFKWFGCIVCKLPENIFALVNEIRINYTTYSIQ